MARFKKFRAPKIATVIGSGTTIHGDVNFTGGLHVDGLICGNVMAEQGGESALTLSEQGRVEGDIQVPNVILNGTVVGDVYASERVELAPKAKVKGTVYYNLLEMAMGAEVNGQLIHTKDAQPQMLGYDGDGPKEEAAEQIQAVATETVGEDSERAPRGR
ncbi:bactofilin family protein [Sedimenticola sp.]|uniref:bactofilin family protein n=1 Tax=Sedimenticola sp. TaxID=1940285 RepID=UPI003D0FC473